MSSFSSVPIFMRFSADSVASITSVSFSYPTRRFVLTRGAKTLSSRLTDAWLKSFANKGIFKPSKAKHRLGTYLFNTSGKNTDRP